MGTTNPVATVKGLCPLLQAQELTSRPRNQQSRAIGLDDAASVSTVRGPLPYPMGPPGPPATVTLGPLLASPPGANRDRYQAPPPRQGGRPPERTIWISLFKHKGVSIAVVSRTTLNNSKLRTFAFSQLKKIWAFLQNPIVRWFLEDFSLRFSKIDRLTSMDPSAVSRRSSFFSDKYIPTLQCISLGRLLPCLVLCPSSAACPGCSCLRVCFKEGSLVAEFVPFYSFCVGHTQEDATNHPKNSGTFPA